MSEGTKGLDGTDHTQVHWDDRTNYKQYVNANGGTQFLGYGVIGNPQPDFVYGVTNYAFLQVGYVKSSV